MKLALLTNFIPPYRLSLYKRIAVKCEKLTVFVSVEMEKTRVWEVNHDGLNVVVQKNWSTVKTWEEGYKTSIHFPYDTIFLLAKYQPQVVISVELGLRSIFSSIYCKLYRKPLILWLALSEHSERNRKGIRTIIRRRLFKHASAILCNGQSAVKYVESFGIKGKMFYIPCTSDYKVESSKKLFSATTKRILYTGQLIKRKGIAELVDSLLNWSAKSPSKKIELLIAGDGPEKLQFERLNEIPNISLQLLGTIDYDELRALYTKADFYLFPTLGDEWGVVVNEAFSCGTPVIGSIYSQAVLELVVENETGWQYDPLKEKSLEKALSNAFEVSEKEYLTIAEKSVEVIADYTPEKVSNEIIKAVDFAVKSYAI